MSTQTSASAEFDIAALPKVSLHDHLDGGLRAATIIDISERIGHELPEIDPARLDVWFQQAADSGSLVRYLETFEHTLAVMQTSSDLRRVAREFVEDLAADGVIYAEVRWAPEQHLREGLSLDEAVEAVQQGIDEAIENIQERGSFIEVGQLVIAMRHVDSGLEIAELALRHRHKGVVGFDIAGPEKGFLPSRFASAFQLLAEQNFPATVHAGEADGLASIQSALVDGRALRLGHGVRIVDDIEVEFVTDDDGEEVGIVSLGELAAWVRDRGIALELSPTSNLHTGATESYGPSLSEHPFDLLYQAGFRVTVNPDNRLMSGTSMTQEMSRLVEEFSYTKADLMQITLNAAQAAFAPLELREALCEQILEAYA